MAWFRVGSSAPCQQLCDCGLAGVVGAFDDFSFDIAGEDDVEAIEFLLDGGCGDEELGVGGAAGFVFDLIGVVAFEDEEAAFRQAIDDTAMQGHSNLGRGVAEDGDDAAPCRGFDRIVGEIGEDGFDRDASLGSECLGLLQPDLREIDGSDGVALLGEPDAVTALAIAETKHATLIATLLALARDSMGLRSQEIVRCCSKDEPIFSVAFIPAGDHRRASGRAY